MNTTPIGHVIIKGVLLALIFYGLALAAGGEQISVIISSDTMGHLEICRDCGPQVQLGGMARRDTLVQDLRGKDQSLLLVDAGNVFFGPDSMESQGKVMVAAYNALGYDVVNLSFRDFRLGKAVTLALMHQAQFPIVSANLLDEKTSAPVAQPYVIKKVDGLKIALIGVTQRPAGLDYLPHLKEQLDGICIQRPLEALTHWLPKAKAEANRVILLYYGSAAGLEPIRKKFGGDFIANLVGGSRPEYLPANTIPPIAGTYDKGQYLAKVQLSGAGAEAKAEVTQIPVELTIAANAEIERVLAEFRPEAARPPATVALQKRETKQPQTKEPSVEKEDQEKLAEVSESIVIGENLRVGMPIADAMALLGMPEGMRSTGTGADKVQWMDYTAKGLAIGARPGKKTLEHIEVQSAFRGRLASGAQMGDHYTTVITKYGMPASMTPEGAHYPDQGLVFKLQNEKVAAIEISLVAEVAKEAAKKGEKAVPPATAFTPAAANNKAVRVEISDITFTGEIAKQQAPRGKTFLIIETRWENIHPKQKVEKDKAKGKRSLTMGAGSLGFGGGAKKTEYVEADVPYQIERLFDHAFALADGLAFALHSTTDNIDGGVPRRQRFTIAKHGEVHEAKLVFLIPKDAKNVAFQFFDYSFGHVALPIQGNLEIARSAKGPAEALAQGKTDLGEFVVTTVDFQGAYVGKSAPQGWHYAVVGLGGKSLLGAQNMRNIVQIDPFKNTWVSSQDVCLYYCSQSSTVDKGSIRFTPEVYQYQELAFLVPASERTFDLGIRLQNDVTWLNMMKAKPKLPGPLATYKDGSVMEVMVLGVRKADGKQIVDLAINSLEARKGIQIQPSRKFMLIAGQRETHLDQKATRTLFRRPPEPFIVPPGTLVRFELAYDTQAEPTALRYQGFQSGKLMALKAAERPEETTTPVVSKAPADTQTFEGHRYKAVAVPEGITWEEAKARAEAMGGYLAVITNDAENTFLHVLVVRDNSLWSISANNNGLGPWLGGYQPVSASEPKGGWSWVNGETWNFTKWAQKEPNNRNGNEDRLHFFGPGKPRGPYWNDIYHGTKLKGFIVEFDGPVEEKPKPVSEEPAAAATKSNKCVELTVVDHTLKDRIGGMEAGEGQVFVVVSTRWKNITQPKKAPPWAHRSLKSAGQVRPKEFVPVELRLSDDFYLLADGKRLAPDSSVANTLPNALPAGKLMLPKPGDQLEGAAAFLVRKDDLSSLLLVYLDKENGDILIPLMASGEGSPEQERDLTEKEPNNSREQANLLRLGEPVEGLFQSKSDSDWYRLDLSAPGISLLRIDLSGVPDIDSGLFLHNAKGELLKRVDGLGWARGEAIVNYGVAAGTYYVKAEACGGCLNTSEKYTLSAKRLGAWSEGQELEPNDSREQANLLRLGEPLEGLFQFKSDSDWYRLDVISSGTSLLRIDLSGVPDLSPQLSLHDADGELLKSTDATERGAAEALVNIGVTTGTYYIQARECCNWNTSNSYTLHAQLVGEWGEGQELEPNDKLEQANTIQLDDLVKGLLQDTKDEDWYRLEITEAGESVLQVDMSGTPGVNSFIALYDAAGKMLVDVEGTGQGGPETLVQVGITQGMYYVVPYSLGGESPGRDETEGYTLTAMVRSLLDQPAALVKEQIDLPSGYNIALKDFGGKVERVTAENPGNYMAAENLIDGAPVYWRIGFMGKKECLSCGWSNKVCRWSSKECQFPQELVFSFFKEREVLINAVVIDTRTKDTLNNPDLIPQHVEIWVSSSSPTENLTRVAGARLKKEAAEQLIRFPPSRGKYVQIRLLSNYGGRVTQVGEVKVFEEVDTKPSILRDFERNLALPELGGAMVRFTSQYSKGYSVGNLVDRSTDTAGWLSGDSYLPQDFVFSFRGDRLALVDRIVLDLGTEHAPNTWPKTISVLISTEHPLDGFREVGQFTLNQQARKQSFPIGLRARFLKLRILENFGGKNTSLGEVKLIEGEAPGYQSILVDWPKQEAVDEAKVVGTEGDVPEHLPEREPNDALEQANLLEHGQFTGGAIDPLGERDCFHISRSAPGPSLLTLDLMGRPNIRAAVELLDEKGEKLGYFDPGTSPTDRTTFSWLVDQQDLWFRLTEPPVSIVLIWDTSGSMRGSTDNLRQALEAFVDQIRADDRLNLIRFSDNVEVLLDKFTSDKAQLKAAIRDQVFAKGGTALYEALAEGIKVLEKVKGNRAIVLMTDGSDTVGELDHPAFWKLMEKKRVRTYAIGMGVYQEIYEPQIASWGKRILGHIALTTNGRTLLAPTKEQLKAQYQEISDELHKSSKYFLKPTFSRGAGFISVVSTGERIAKTLPPWLELILDCSGSMRERKRKIDGKLKIDVAKEVISDIIQSLPKEMEVALRIYGHRIREGRSGDCKDSQLVVPFGRLNKAKLLQQVQKIKALGTTPLAYALEKAAEDFPKGSGEKLIVLVTDGKEECGGEPAKVAQRLVREGLNVRINVVGFALADENVKQDMRQVAEITGGYFFDAQNRQGLRASLQSALAVPFDVVDASGVQVGSGLSGQGPIQVPEGLYTVIVRGAGEPIVVPDVRIISDQFCRVEVKKEGQEIGTRILGPMAREKAQQIALSGPSVQRVVNLEKGEALGINVEDAAAGLRIAAVEAGSAGEAVGVKVGDLITHIDGEPVKIRQNFIAAIRKVSLGKRKQVTVSIRCGLEVISLAVGSKVITPVPEKTTVEKEGKKGSDPQILNAQRCLQRVGFDPGPADGLWGKKTAEALREFQKWYPHQKLAVTGQLDEQTYAALQEAETRQTRPKRSKVKSAAKFCNQCGAPLKPKANFCTKCGARVTR